MRTEDFGVARRTRSCVLFSIIMLFVLGADDCPNQQASRALNKLLTSLSQTSWGGIELNDLKFLRVHLYPKTIEKNEYVESFSLQPTTGAPNRQECKSEGGCLLFFVDTNHYAHFAHQTVVALWRIDEESFQTPIVGEWWPLLNGKPIFDKVRKREDWTNPTDPDTARTIVYPTDYQRDYFAEFRIVDPIGISVQDPVSYRLVAAEIPPTGEETEACSVWAVIVNGYDDPEDTFHIDTGGMYMVLRGHGIPIDQIHFLCPNPLTTEGCDDQVIYTKLKEVLTETLPTAIPFTTDLADSECQELLLFYSSHGGDEHLWCGECEDCSPISFTNLSNWLDKVPCHKITVVVEACKSGGLIDYLKNAQLAGQKRFIFTSTSEDESSYRDIDKHDSDWDNNPGDIGSETVWGYVESIGTSMTDGNNDKEISFAEGSTYAKDFDITTLMGNELQVFDDGLSAVAVPSCADGPGTDQLKIELTQEEVVQPADLGEVLRCRCNQFKATVSLINDGGPADPPPVASARFYWTDVPWNTDLNPTWQPNKPNEPDEIDVFNGDFREIQDSTRLLADVGADQSIELHWEIGTNISAGSVITLLAVVDSPAFPIADASTGLNELLDDNLWASALKLKVINPSSCCLFPCKGGNRRCEHDN